MTFYSDTALLFSLLLQAAFCPYYTDDEFREAPM